MRCDHIRFGVALTMAGTCLGPVGPIHGFDSTSARPDSAVIAAGSDSVYMLPAIVVRAARLTRQEELDRLPGAATVLDLEEHRSRFASVAEAIERVPGLHVRDYGSLGSYSTVSIRGSTSQQITIYLDGIPLARAGLGADNLADLPFAALDRIEVYRGAAPASLPGAGIGGAINLVTRRPQGARGETTLLLGGGSFDTRRIGFTHRAGAGAWDALVVAEGWRTRGDFHFHDDHGTPLEAGDDAWVARRNNATEHQEALAQLATPMRRLGGLRIAHQGVRRRLGVPGISSNQSWFARAGLDHHLTSIDYRTPRFARDRAAITLLVAHDWRRDAFVDSARGGEIGLGLQDDRDESRAWTAHALLEARPHWSATTTLDAQVRRERFAAWRLLAPEPARPVHRRSQLEIGIEQRQRLGRRLELHAGCRWTEVRSDIAGDLRSTATRDVDESYREPRAGLRLRLGRGLHARANAGRSHRTPGFLELFHDGGTIRGNPGLVAETGTRRDAGLQWEGRARRLQFRAEATLFDHDTDNLISLRQAANTYVAMNIGRADLDGQEFAWSCRDESPARRWSLEGNYTHLRALDASTRSTLYTGKELPLQPAHQFFQRLALRAHGCEVGYELDALGRNFLNRWNTVAVPRRDLHAVDLRIAWRGLDVHAGVRNLTDVRAADVANFPLPGRTFFATSSIHF